MSEPGRVKRRAVVSGKYFQEIHIALTRKSRAKRSDGPGRCRPTDAPATYSCQEKTKIPTTASFMTWTQEALDRLVARDDYGYAHTGHPASEPTALAALALATHGRLQRAMLLGQQLRDWQA